MRVSSKNSLFVQSAGNSKLRCQHTDFFIRTSRQQLLRPLGHTDNPERMRPPQTVYTKHRQRIAGYNYLLNIFGCQPINYFSHKTADFLEPLKKAGVEAVILSCTHYPFIKEQIEADLGPKVKVLDPAAATSADAIAALKNINTY